MMKTILDKLTRKELISRISLLEKHNKPKWGKMNVYQMLSHCIKYEQMMQGKVSYKRLLIGYLFGKSALMEDFLRDDSPIKKNVPTLKQLKISKNVGDFELDKKKWAELINDYENLYTKGIVHPFFGKLSIEQIGYLVYKHTDHHLRQFGV